MAAVDINPKRSRTLARLSACEPTNVTQTLRKPSPKTGPTSAPSLSRPPTTKRLWTPPWPATCTSCPKNPRFPVRGRNRDEKCQWLIPPQVPQDCTHTYWCYTCRLDEEALGVDWRTFRKTFIEHGGDGLLRGLDACPSRADFPDHGLLRQP